MYALFEGNTFKAIIEDIESWQYRADAKYMLYKIEAKLYPIHKINNAIRKVPFVKRLKYLFTRELDYGDLK